MTQKQTIPDIDLLRQVAAGDEHAFRRLFDDHRDRLFVFINRIVHSEEVSEELVMDVFMKIWLGRELLPQVKNIKAFLYRVARNKALNYIREIGRNPELKKRLVEYLQQSGEESADSALMIKEYEALLREAVGLLTPQRKEAWRLSREENLTHDQIAERMQITPRTVRFHIDEAKSFIRQHLTKKGMDVALVLVLDLTIS